MSPAAVLAPAAAIAAGPALAAFGAIAYAPSVGAYGVGLGSESREQAERAAMADCGGYAGDCAVNLTFEHACGALARGGDASRRAAEAAATLREAEALALAACARLGAGCRIEMSFCSDR
ncbi:DUF4189 domain-containing protein [Rubrimonas cliftonensis]|uniref:DUF4189 domain-containing protein n=1 Tax=Rubrimonas cliftonensis TaxID=89524 RepID=A0A1H3XQL1_9RHOB|nr:DUF4189 domain-containing protein [Rubrimonas cliftonensis]SEA01745.1 protein of unknown function [Rubrimonas cliftonensis]